MFWMIVNAEKLSPRKFYELIYNFTHLFVQEISGSLFKETLELGGCFTGGRKQKRGVAPIEGAARTLTCKMHFARKDFIEFQRRYQGNKRKSSRY